MLINQCCNNRFWRGGMMPTTKGIALAFETTGLIGANIKMRNASLLNTCAKLCTAGLSDDTFDLKVYCADQRLPFFGQVLMTKRCTSIADFNAAMNKFGFTCLKV